MGRILAIDFGGKRTGIAVTDELQIIASGLTTVPTAELLSFLKEYTSKETVDAIVVGQPKRLNNEFSDIEAEIRLFIHKLKEEIPKMEIERIDERFTSKMAFQSMIDSGVKKKNRRKKELLDEVSATLILQSYLHSKK
ncbi:Holliday junction resolvase RuvX [Galbibacter pacificus]|uniref:Putative pre-16S rRNA nuclease n=1 Tax=Galbibacter pacificus TaxID=2996052 RepID=A0ABT6FUI5_9FLAO|nr:Holliday junction resolvase RuvX [Galbibacter pacificus]MDG3583607.1 Holliday junction resolvase RuvX [Galbibacter pacificus]MDG3586917.1 Holliday junction resolvase RuvX [Galbibacter pacificus]